MVIAFDDRPHVMTSFTSDKHQLLRAIEAIEPSDGGSALEEAITVARAFAQPADNANERSAVAAADLELFSDGKIVDIADILTNPDEVFYHRIGESEDNVAIVAMEARRSYRKMQEVSVFATLVNYGPKPARCDVQLSLDGDIRSVRTVTVPPRGNDEKSELKQISLSFELIHGGAGVVGVRQMRPDGLAADDVAWAVLPPPKKLAVLLVTRGDWGLQTGLKSCSLRELKIVTPEEFAAMDHASMTIEQPYDVIVLDGVAPAQLPRCRYLVFGPPPKASGVGLTGALGPQAVVDWRERHPVMQHLNLANVVVSKAHKLDVPRDGVLLAEFGDGPAIALVNRSGSTFILAAFDAMNSNWPWKVSFVMFCQNAVNYLGMEIAQGEQRALKVGDAITIRADAAAGKAAVTGPNDLKTDVTIDPSGTVRFPGTERVGVYTVAVPGRPDELFAVNLLNAAESDIAALDQVEVSGQAVEASQSVVRRTAQEVWPWLVVAALVLACVEWVVYNSKVRL